MDVSLMIIVCCQVEVCALRQSLIQRSLAECGVSECDPETSIIRRPGLTRGYQIIAKIVGSSYVVERHWLIENYTISKLKLYTR
jgi:hypothetical protein